MDENIIDLGGIFYAAIGFIGVKINYDKGIPLKASYPDKAKLDSDEFLNFYFFNKDFCKEEIEQTYIRAITDKGSYLKKLSEEKCAPNIKYKVGYETMQLLEYILTPEFVERFNSMREKEQHIKTPDISINYVV